jgi:serine/threonine protein kinase
MLEAEQILHNRYQIKQKLGHNAGRQTWLAQDLETQETVIIKLLAFGGDIQWDDLKLFEREAQVLKQLNHPQIPKYRDYFSIDDRVLWFCLVQEYIPGSSLKDLLQERKKFTEKEVYQIGIQVLKILHHLHRLNPPVLHRDIKPSNLILGENNQVYLVDFGAVQDRAVTEGATFTVVGTYGYAPLEQFGGRAVPASDLYALGATLIHLLTGIPPADLPQQNLRIQFQEIVTLKPELANWLEKLTEPAVERRFQSAGEALNALKKPKKPKSVKVEDILVSKPIYFQQETINNSGCGGLFYSNHSVPEEIKGWNWGAFLLSTFWPVTNHVWIGLLSWTPQLGILMAFILGAKGNEWAWKSRQWRSIEQFKAHQRGWAIAGILLGLPFTIMVWGLAYYILTQLL